MTGYADLYFSRAWAYERKGLFDLAIRDYSQAIRLDPNFADAYGNRGVMRLYRGRFEEAADDFKSAFETADGTLKVYSLLWLFLGRQRHDGGGMAELRAGAAKIPLDRWPGPIVAMFLGRIPPQEVLVTAAGAGPAERRQRECVAFFFLGQERLLDGDPDGARHFFQRAVETGVDTYLQYWAAGEELARLARVD